MRPHDEWCEVDGRGDRLSRVVVNPAPRDPKFSTILRYDAVWLLFCRGFPAGSTPAMIGRDTGLRIIGDRSSLQTLLATHIPADDDRKADSQRFHLSSPRTPAFRLTVRPGSLARVCSAANFWALFHQKRSRRRAMKSKGGPEKNQ